MKSDMAAPTNRPPEDRPLAHDASLRKSLPIFAVELLAEGGHFLAKTFQGGTEKDLLNMLKQNFRQVMHIKPCYLALRNRWKCFLLAKGFKGRKAGVSAEQDVSAVEDDGNDE